MDRRLIATDGLTQSVLEAGEGPLVLLIHGFPELAISWRAQIDALAAAGYRAVAPDMRGYGEAMKPERTEDHTILHLVGDMVDLVRALGERSCVVVGHDWGSSVAWHCVLMRPDMFTAEPQSWPITTQDRSPSARTRSTMSPTRCRMVWSSVRSVFTAAP